MSDYKYHLAIYSKLIRGRTPDGPVKPGVEAKIVGATEDFPEKFQELCSTSLFFPENPPVTKIDARKMEGGTFAFVPVYLRGEHLSVFARIEARPERGVGQGGRRFTHSAILIVKEKWEPGLISWAARMLFTDQCGGRCWGLPIYEHQDDRRALRPPAVTRQDLALRPLAHTDLPHVEDLTSVSRLRLPTPELEAVTTGPHPQVHVADWIADMLQHGGYAVQGRFLSFSCGHSDELNGPGDGGFYIALDSRNNNSIEQNAPLGFSDRRPVRIPPGMSDTKAIIPAWRRISHEGLGNHRLQGNTLDTNNFWPDQMPAGLPGTSPEDVIPEKQSYQAKFVQEYQEQRDEHSIEFAVRETVDGQRTPESPETVQNVPSEPTSTYAHPEPAPDTHRGLEEAPYDDSGFRDPVYWPTLYMHESLSADDMPPVSRENLEWIEAAFRHLEARLHVIGADPFDKFPDDDVIVRKVVGAFRDLWELLLYFAAAGGDVNDLRGDLDRIFTHDAFPELGIEAGSTDGLFAFLFIKNIALSIEIPELVRTVEAFGKRERNAARYVQHRDKVHIHVDVPDTQGLKSLLLWLNEFKFCVGDRAVYNANLPIWWDNGIKPYFSELISTLDELYQSGN